MYNMFKLLPLTAAIALAACGGADKAASGAAAGGDSACGKLAADEVCVKIGSGAPKTGGIAHLGKDNENGVQLAVNEINAKGGLVIGGKKVKLALVGEDDAACSLIQAEEIAMQMGGKALQTPHQGHLDSELHGWQWGMKLLQEMILA